MCTLAACHSYASTDKCRVSSNEKEETASTSLAAEECSSVDHWEMLVATAEGMTEYEYAEMEEE